MHSTFITRIILFIGNTEYSPASTHPLWGWVCDSQKVKFISVSLSSYCHRTTWNVTIYAACYYRN